MKYAIFFLGIMASLSAFAAPLARIQAVSNIQADRFVLSVFTGDEKKPRALVELNANELKTQTLPWPEDLKDQEVMGLFLMKDRLFLISQATAGGGKFPHVHHYDRTAKKWSDLGEVKCRSFDTVEIKNGKMSFDCEADPLLKTKAGPKVLKLAASGEQKKESLKLVLPLENASEGKYAYKLEGSMFAWKSVEVSNGPDHKKILTAEQLLP